MFYRKNDLNKDLNDIDYQIKSENIISNANRGTKISTTTTLSRPTQEMIDNYKESLIKPYTDTTTGKKFLYTQPTAPAKLNDVEKMQDDLNDAMEKNLKTIEDEKRQLIGEINNDEISIRNKKMLFQNKRINQEKSFEDYLTFVTEVKDKEKENKKSIKEMSDELDINVATITRIGLVINKLNTVKQALDLLPETTKAEKKDKENKLNIWYKDKSYYVDALNIEKNNYAEKKIMYEEIEKKINEQEKELKNKIRKIEESLSDSSTDLNDLFDEKKDILAMENDMKIKMDALQRKIEEYDLENMKLDSDRKDIYIAKQENKEKIDKWNMEFKQLNQHVSNIPAKEPGESDNSYYKRLEAFSEQQYNDDDVAESLKYKLLVKIKDKFSDVFDMNNARNMALVESFMKDYIFNDISSLNNILSKWPLFKNLLLNSFGYNNLFVTNKQLMDIWLDLMNIKISSTMSSSLSTKTNETYQNSKNYVFVDDATPPKSHTLHYIFTLISEDRTKDNNNQYIFLSLSGLIGEYKLVDFNVKLLKEKKLDNATIDTFSDKIKETNILNGLFDDDAALNLVISGFISEIIKLLEGDQPYFLTEPLLKLGTNTRNKHLRKDRKNKIIGAGICHEEKNKYVHFGHVVLLFNKLMKDNVLSLKDKKLNSIMGFKNVYVSDVLVNIINKLMIDPKADISVDYIDLGQDLETFNRLMMISGLDKKIKIPKPTPKIYKDKITVILGEIEAGNDSSLLLDDLKHNLNQLVLFKAITKKEATRFYNDIIGQ